MPTHSALGFDFAGSARWEISVSERGLVADVRPVWAGVRDYGGRREFRAPEQLKAPGFLRTLERAPLLLGHPRDGAGRFVYVGASAPEGGEVLAWAQGQAAAYPFRDWQVGSLGDRIEFEEHGGIELPVLRASLTHPRAIGLALGMGGRNPRREVSLGFVKHVIEESGVWTSPTGEQLAYDAIQIIDPDDPRVPAELRPWVGANYLGVGFGDGESRGEYTRLGLDGLERAEGRTGPRTFFLIRQADETGVSGTGHVLDGVVWPDGKVTTKWCAEGSPSELNVAESYEEWDAIHVSKHPTNRSLVVFDDGAEPPPIGADPYPNEHASRQLDPEEWKVVGSKQAAPGIRLLFAKRDPKDPEEPTKVQAVRFDRHKYTPDEAQAWLESHGYKTTLDEASPDEGDSNPENDQGEAMDPEKMMQEIAALKAALAEKDKMIADLKAKMGAGEDMASELKAKEEDLAKAAASMDAQTKAIAKLEAELAPVRAAAKAERVAAVAKRAGIDAKELETVEVDKLEVAAMRKRIALGMDGHISEAYRDNDIYLRAAYDHLPQVQEQAGEVSQGFAAAVAGDGKTTAAPKVDNPLDALP